MAPLAAGTNAAEVTFAVAFSEPVLGLTATGDGTLKGRLQTVISYGLSLTSLLLQPPRPFPGPRAPALFYG